MTQQQFLQNFYCRVDIQDQGGINRVIITEAIDRNTSNVVDMVMTTHNIQAISQAIAVSQSQISLMAFDWGRIIDMTIRMHLYYFTQRFQIDDYYPNDLLANPDISVMFI